MRSFSFKNFKSLKIKIIEQIVAPIQTYKDIASGSRVAKCSNLRSATSSFFNSNSAERLMKCTIK